MANFYIQRVISQTPSTIDILFTDDIVSTLTVENITITPQYDSFPTPQVISVVVDEDTLSLTFSPMFDNVKYKITFLSTDNQKFVSTSGAILNENNNTNVLFVVSPGSDTVLLDTMLTDLGPVYNTDAPSLIRDIVHSSEDQISKVSDQINDVLSDNYISITTTDELITRGDGAIDKFLNGGTYEVLRVGATPTGANKSTEIVFDSSRQVEFATYAGAIINPILLTITSDPISLQGIDVVNEIVSDDINLPNFFNGLTINVSKGQVIQVISVALVQEDGTVVPYDINTFGYILEDNSYDTKTASQNVTLGPRQVELSTTSLNGLANGFILPAPGDTIKISYLYRNLGRAVDPTSVALTTIKQSIRELVPGLITSFFLNNAPIVTSTGIIPTAGGVTFQNSQAFNGNPPLSTTDPAFLKEIPFSTSSIPNAPGVYSVNYQTGQVFVYGSDGSHQGTGSSPASATYYYQQTFIQNTDYTYDSDTSALALKSNRDLAGITAQIAFNYEDTYAENQDFRFLSHIEVINERVNNNLIGAFQISTNNAPITDVFRIFNETTGEIYTLDRFNDTVVSFTGNKAPRQATATREIALFVSVPQESLILTDTFENTSGLKVFGFKLENSGIMDRNSRNIGANFDTSAVFSDQSVFVREFFYEDKLFTNVQTNLNRLQQIGDYSIDYDLGFVYVAVADDQDQDVGYISYNYDSIQTVNQHILQVNNVYRSQSSLSNNVENYPSTSFTDTTIEFSGLEDAGERFIDGDTNRVIIVGSYQNGKDGIVTANSNVFVSNSAVFTIADVGRTLTVGSADDTPVEGPFFITSVVNQHQVVVDTNYSVNGQGREWVVLDTDAGDPKTITVANNIVSIVGIYSVDELGTLPASELTNYFDSTRDSFSGNTITLGDSNPLTLGTAVSVDYNFGLIYTDYNYLADNLLITYEYGPNALDWSISNTLKAGDEYYATYKYGALRNALLLNFGSLTQIPELTNFPYDFNREVYRSVVGGTIQSFIEGPTIPSIKTLVESFTGVEPVIEELGFDSWILGRDYLYRKQPFFASGIPTYDLGKFNDGVSIVNKTDGVEASAISQLRLTEGTLEAWIKPNWDGTANDATLTFDIYVDGYQDLSQIFIGQNSVNPTSTPFSLNKNDQNTFEIPQDYATKNGYYIWYDISLNNWNIRFVSQNPNTNFYGTINSSGTFYDVSPVTVMDGYITDSDTITTLSDLITFNATIDGYLTDYSVEGITFNSGDTHYIFDMAVNETYDRMSLFKDGVGYLNFLVYDQQGKYSNNKIVGRYNLSTNIQNWKASEVHQVAITWGFNSADEKDDMHLFVDGQEVPNLYKFGGNPPVSLPTTIDYGDVAKEIITQSAPKNIIGGSDGKTTAGQNLFITFTTNFVQAGIAAGDTLYILEPNQDGTIAPYYAAPYLITAVGINELRLDHAPTLNLENINFSVNQLVYYANTPVTYQNFIVVKTNSDGTTELNGLESEYPDYMVNRGSGSTQVLTITNGINAGDEVSIETLGLVFRRCRETEYVYDGYQIRTNSAPPVSNIDAKFYLINLPRTLIDSTGTLNTTQVSQPTNTVTGRQLSVTLSGENIDFPAAMVTINGTTFGGATSEILIYSDSTTQTTVNFWTSISSVDVVVATNDPLQNAGAVEVKELNSITVSDNNGDYAELFDYSNGLFSFEVYGSGGSPFLLSPGRYLIDYPTFLRIRIDEKPKNFIIGNDYTFSYPFDGVIDEFRILSSQITDLRPGDVVTPGQENVTTDFNSIDEFSDSTDTLFLAHFDDNLDDSSTYRDAFTVGFPLAPSLNAQFDTAIVLNQYRPYVINNGQVVFDNNQGTIEFWLNPLEDFSNDPNYRYYIDMTSDSSEDLTSITNTIVTSLQKIKTVKSVRLATDTFATGTDYFAGGTLSNVDNKTITLGTPLPAQNTPVVVTYTPLSSTGDRVSIFKDPQGYINFAITGNGIDYVVSMMANFKRHTWHRIMVLYQANSVSGQDFIRLFVDGEERGIIKYGTGIIYGTGYLYGSAEVRAGVNRFPTTKITLTDTFANIYLGTDTNSVNPAFALMDNLRFSDIQRLNSIATVGGYNIDLNYNANIATAVPVISDDYTTGLYNFDSDSEVAQYLATLYGADSQIFDFKVEVIDSFDRISESQDLQNLLVQLINTIKPAHTTAYVTFTK